ncbi:hypothetical protein LXL04_018655 [Taraxacum kok-saghyz]
MKKKKMRSSELWFPSLMAEEEEEDAKQRAVVSVAIPKIHRLEVVKSRGISWRLISSFEKALIEEEELEPVDCSLGEMKLRRRRT